MKLCYKVCISKCIEVDFQQIYDYIRTQNPNFSLEDIEWSFRDSVDYYLRVLYDAYDFRSEDNEYRTEDLCIAWSKWLKKNMKFIREKDNRWHNPKEELPPITTNIEFIDSSDNVRKGEIVVEMSGFYLYIRGEGWRNMDIIKQWRFV